jgi:hypothetical protein
LVNHNHDKDCGHNKQSAIAIHKDVYYMKQSLAILIFRLTSLASLAFATLAFATGDTAIADDTQPDVTVGVYALHSGGKIAYHYRVANNSQQNITAVTIGRDNQNDGNPNNDVNELHGLPAGWNSKLGIPTTSASSPTGWRVSVIAPEENENHAIAWETMNDRAPKILAGQTVNKMSIALDKADNNYLTGHALVTYSDGDPINLTVPLERLDNTPPSLTVYLSPDTLISQNVKAVAINASFTIKDDYDRMPEIKLESITANEPLEANDIRDASIGLDDRYFKLLAVSKSTAGRVYTVTYSATDASGNQTIASATVTVIAPREQNEQEKAKVESK